MGKDDFSTEGYPSEPIEDRRRREEYESLDQKYAEDGSEMAKKGAHSNLGIGDEQNPIEENEKH